MKEIKTNNGTKGGWLVGKRHYDKQGNSLGGIKAIVTDAGGKPVELEGGEVIINREASKKHWKELSKINQSAGNGVAIAPPSDIDEDPSEEYQKGGKIQFNANHLPSKWVLSFAEKIRTKHPEIWKKGGNIFGNEAYENLKRVSKRGYWLDSEEWMYIKWRAYVARHKGDFQLPGVVAMLKWVDKVDKGWKYMKDLIEAEIAEKSDNKMKDGGSVQKNNVSGSIKFMKWFVVWYKQISHKINIAFSLPNALQPFKENNVVILDLFEKIDQNIDAKKYLQQIVNKADEYNVIIYLEPKPRYKYILNNVDKVNKISKEYLISYYEKFGFKLTSDKIFMKRLPKQSNDKKEKGGNIQKYAFVEGITTDGKKVYKIFDYIPTHKKVYDYFKNSKHKNNNGVILVDSEIKIETLTDFDRTKFLKAADKIAMKNFGYGIADKNDLIFVFDKNKLIVFPFEARLKNGKEVKISLIDGVILIEPNISNNIRFEQGGNVLLAPNGKPSNLTPEQYKLVRTESFKNWFGDWENDPANASKVVDENGEPLMVYHGTNSKFNTFELKTAGKRFNEEQNTNSDNGDYGMWGVGFYFSPIKKVSKRYGIKLMKLFLNIRNPFVRNPNLTGSNTEFKPVYGRIESINLREEILSKGYDGVIHIEGTNKIPAPIMQIIAFEPNQIKLADGTNTTFSSDSDDIRFEQGGEIKNYDYIDYDSYTPELEEKLYKSAVSYFDKKVTDDYWHFSTQYFNGEEITYEVHSEKGSFWLNFKIKNNNLLLSSARLEKIQKFAKGGQIETYKEKYNSKYNYPLNESHSLEEISNDTGISIKGLQQIYNKGIGAYKTNPESVRPNVKSKEQWAMARVYSAVMGGDAAKIDYKELKMEQGGSIDQRDTVTMDIPLLIRTLELSREDITSDADLHRVVENLIDLKNKPVLTMSDYEYIADIEHKHLQKMEVGGTIDENNFEKLLSQAHTNLTVKMGRKDYAPNKDELQEEIDKIIMEKQFGSNNI